MGYTLENPVILCNFVEEKEMWFQTVIYVILKDRNVGLILDENLSFLDMMEPHLSSIQ